MLRLDQMNSPCRIMQHGLKYTGTGASCGNLAKSSRHRVLRLRRHRVLSCAADSYGCDV